MDVIETTLEGTIQPDGTLILDGPTNLPAGRVQVVVRSTERKKADWAEFSQMLREFEETKQGEGTAARSIAEREAIRREMEEELDQVARLQEESRRRRAESSGGASAQ